MKSLQSKDSGISLSGISDDFFVFFYHYWAFSKTAEKALSPSTPNSFLPLIPSSSYTKFPSSPKSLI
jgi:hypothetical protein